MDFKMERLIIIPQYPTLLRYQQWWMSQFLDQFEKRYDKIIMLGPNPYYGVEEGNKYSESNFAPTEKAILFELSQMAAYSKMKIQDTDTLLLCDLSYPGLFSSLLFHKRPKKCYAICHATSKNKYDIFSKVRSIKYPIEKNTAQLFDKIFVGSQYHAEKLGWPNIEVHPLPLPTFPTYYVKWNEKEFDFVTVARSGIQKRTKRIEKHIKMIFGKEVVPPPPLYTWNDYYSFLSKSRFLIITAKEETFGYQVVDAILNGCIPIAPRAYSYPELLPDQYLYSTEMEMGYRIHQLMANPIIPELLVQDKCTLFYTNLTKSMKA